MGGDSSLAPLALFLAAAIAAPAALGAAVFAVTSVEDAVDAAPGDASCASTLAGAPCTLRAAIEEANALAGRDRIELPAGLYTLAISGAGENLAATGDLDVVEALEIAGAGESATTVEGALLDRILDLRPGAAPLAVALRDITLRHGRAPFAEGGSCARVPANTGLDLFRVTFTGCETRNGGALWVAGSVTGREVTFRDNTGPAGDEDSGTGGAIALEGPGASLELARALFDGNRASNGGGIHATGGWQIPPRATIHVVDSTFTGNRALQFGGAVLANSSTDLLFENCTFSGNVAGFGGAIGNDGGCFIALHGCTITGNSGAIGGGISEVHFDPSLIELRNTILAGNSSPNGPDCNFRLHSDGGSLIGSLSGCQPTLTPTDLVGAPAMPGALALDHPLDRVPVLPLLEGSAAIDSGVADFCPPRDQRGVARPLDGDGESGAGCDIGAFEVAPGLLFHDGFEDGGAARWTVGDELTSPAGSPATRPR